jgi:hypothetical protein
MLRPSVSTTVVLAITTRIIHYIYCKLSPAQTRSHTVRYTLLYTGLPPSAIVAGHTNQSSMCAGHGFDILYITHITRTSTLYRASCCVLHSCRVCSAPSPEERRKNNRCSDRESRAPFHAGCSYLDRARRSGPFKRPRPCSRRPRRPPCRLPRPSGSCRRGGSDSSPPGRRWRASAPRW